MAIEAVVMEMLRKNHSQKYLDKLLSIREDGTAMFKDVGASGPLDLPYMSKEGRQTFELIDEMRELQKGGKKVERVPLKKKIVRVTKTNKKEAVMAKKVNRVPLTKREQELKAIEEYVKTKGVIKHSGRGPVMLDDEDDWVMPEPDLTPLPKATKRVPPRVTKTNKKEVVQMKKVEKKAVVKKATKKSEPVKVTKKAQPKPTKEVAVKKSKKATNVPSPFEGDTFGNYTIDIPDKAFGSKKKLIQWMTDNNRLIIEYKKSRGRLGAYQPERDTRESNRVASVTVKKQGERHVVTYRSNKNSKASK